MNKKNLYSNKCRTCFNHAKGMQSLHKLSHFETALSFAELLKEVVNVNITDDISNEMPQQICMCCSRKLESSHAFIKQAQAVNEKLCYLLSSTTTNGLEESEIDIDKCLKIKMECDEDDAIDTTKHDVDLSSGQNKLLFKIEKLEDNYSLSKHKVGDDNVKVENNKNVNGNQQDNLDVFKTAERCTDNNNVRARSEFKQQDDLSTEIDQVNSSKISANEFVYSDSDSEDDKCLSFVKANMLKDSSKEPGAPKIPRKRKKKISSQKEIIEDGDLAVPCQICNKIFLNSRDLATHLRKAHVPDDKKCACPVCGAAFTRASSMYTHMKTFHKTEYLQTIPTPREREHECDKCHRKYSTLKSLTYHVQCKHNNEEETKQEVKKSEASTKKRSLCCICGTTLSSNYQLIIHMRGHTGERPFKCELCDMTFRKMTDLNRHMRIHTGEKPHKCKICEKAFRVSTKLANHMRSHTDERPYKCSQCERAFKYSKDLNIHNRIHTGERPYSCNVCGNTFTQSNSLKTHRMKLGHMDNND